MASRQNIARGKSSGLGFALLIPFILFGWVLSPGKLKTCFLSNISNLSQNLFTLVCPLGCSSGMCIDALDTLPMTAEEVTGPGFASAASAGDMVSIDDSQDQRRDTSSFHTPVQT